LPYANEQSQSKTGRMSSSPEAIWTLTCGLWFFNRFRKIIRISRSQRDTVIRCESFSSLTGVDGISVIGVGGPPLLHWWSIVPIA